MSAEAANKRGVVSHDAFIEDFPSTFVFSESGELVSTLNPIDLTEFAVRYQWIIKSMSGMHFTLPHVFGESPVSNRVELLRLFTSGYAAYHTLCRNMGVLNRMTWYCAIADTDKSVTSDDAAVDDVRASSRRASKAATDAKAAAAAAAAESAPTVVKDAAEEKQQVGDKRKQLTFRSTSFPCSSSATVDDLVLSLTEQLMSSLVRSKSSIVEWTLSLIRVHDGLVNVGLLGQELRLVRMISVPDYNISKEPVQKIRDVTGASACMAAPKTWKLANADPDVRAKLRKSLVDAGVKLIPSSTHPTLD